MARALHIGRASGRAADRGTYRQQEVLDAGSGTKLAQHRPFIGTSGTKLAQHAIKRQFWALFVACRANIVTLAAQPSRAGRKLSPTGHGNTSVLKEKSPLHEVLRAVVKHFSPMHVHKSHFWPISTEQGRYFFHCGCMPSTGAIRWGDISFRTRPRPTDRASDPDAPKQTPATWRRRRNARRRARRAQHGGGEGGRAREHTRPSPTRLEATAWPAGPGRGAGGQRQGLAGLRGDAPIQTTATGPHWCGGHRRDRRARAGFEARRRTK